jgi:hypothetical protein
MMSWLGLFSSQARQNLSLISATGFTVFLQDLRIQDFSSRTSGSRPRPKSNVIVWAKGGKNGKGRALELSEALIQATLLGATRTIQVEVDGIIRNRRLSEMMDSLGVSIIKIYRDPAPPYLGNPKLEVVFDRPPLRPNIAEARRWIDSYNTYSTMVSELRKSLAY